MALNGYGNTRPGGVHIEVGMRRSIPIHKANGTSQTVAHFRQFGCGLGVLRVTSLLAFWSYRRIKQPAVVPLLVS